MERTRVAEALVLRSRNPELYRTIVEGVEHHMYGSSDI
jgi:hypothetical protein